MCNSTLRRSGMPRVNEGSHSFTCHPHLGNPPSSSPKLPDGPKLAAHMQQSYDTYMQHTGTYAVSISYTFANMCNVCRYM